MASGRRIFQTKITECNILFEGLVQSSIRAKLTIEMLKYLVHQRNQIPLSYELVKRDFDSDLEETTSYERPTKRKSAVRKLEALKRKNAMTALDKIFNLLEDVFVQVHPIPEVLILFGPTVVSPKELYRLRFPTKCYEGKVLNWTNCRMTLFQQLVSADVFGTVKPLKPGTKVSILFCAPSDVATKSLGLIAKPNFKLSHRGSHYVFNVVCKGKEIKPEISFLDASLNISGIEPFDPDSPNISQVTPLVASTPSVTPLTSRNRSYRRSLPSLHRRVSMLESVEESPQKDASKEINEAYRHGTEGTVSLVNGDVLTNHGEDNSDANASNNRRDSLSSKVPHPYEMNIPAFGDCDMMWFQLPISMKGFKDKTSKVA